MSHHVIYVTLPFGINFGMCFSQHPGFDSCFDCHCRGINLCASGDQSFLGFVPRLDVHRLSSRIRTPATESTQPGLWCCDRRVPALQLRRKWFHTASLRLPQVNLSPAL
jgi:hypothetical protein